MSKSIIHTVFTYSFAFSLFVFYSCNRDKKQQEIDQLVESELEQISFNEVDQYPFFPKCNEYDEKQENINCFYQELKHYLSSGLDTLSIELLDQKQYLLIIQVNSDGKVSLKELKSVHENKAKIESIFQHQIQQMPTLFPAQKRGVLVNSEYQVPIYFKPTN